MQRVQEALIAPEERVTLKLDVSHVFHSHMIGRGGVQVQRLMQETGAHVHFPDCNRQPPLQPQAVPAVQTDPATAPPPLPTPSPPRSNLVSAAGRLRNVEHARRRLRELTPLVFSVEARVGAGGGGGGGAGGEGSLAAVLAAAAAVQRQLGVSVRARPHPDHPDPDPVALVAALGPVASAVLGVQAQTQAQGCSQAQMQAQMHMQAQLQAPVVLQLQVRGALRDLPRLRAACAALAASTRADAGPEGSTQVQSWVQMSPYNQGAALGRAGEQLRRIEVATGARLSAPPRSDPSVPPARRGCVAIAGPFDAVFLARQQLLGSLPLKLVFDVPEHLSAFDNGLVAQLMNVLGVSITTFQKERQHLTTVTIRGIERYATNIYEARRFLLGLPDPPVIADIPETYHIPFKSSPMKTPPYINNSKECASGSSAGTSPSASPPCMSPRPVQSPTKNEPSTGASCVTTTSKPLHCSWLEMINSLDFLQNCVKSESVKDFANEQKQCNSNGNNVVDLQTLANYLQSSASNASSGQDHCALNSYFGVDEILKFLGLEKYVELFRAEEIDWPVFQTLNEQDLLNIGITAYGARRKLLGIIEVLKKANIPFCGSAAPGAERRDLQNGHSLTW